MDIVKVEANKASQFELEGALIGRIRSQKRIGIEPNQRPSKDDLKLRSLSPARSSTHQCRRKDRRAKR